LSLAIFVIHFSGNRSDSSIAKKRIDR